MPMNSIGSYEAPQSENELRACTCSISIGASERLVHSSECPVSKEASEEILEELPFGASFPAFVHEWEAIDDPHAGPIEDDSTKVGRLVAALIEEQRTANLIAIANGSAFSQSMRHAAHAHVIERLGQHVTGDEPFVGGTD